MLAAMLAVIILSGLFSKAEYFKIFIPFSGSVPFDYYSNTVYLSLEILALYQPFQELQLL